MKSDTIHELTGKIKQLALQLRGYPEVEFGYSTLIMGYAQEIEAATLLPDEQQERIEELEAQVKSLRQAAKGE